MPEKSITTRKTREQIKRALRELPAVFSGKVKDENNVGRMFRAVFIQTMFTKIHDAYLVKSTGRPDELGVVWKPNSPATLAARPLLPGDKSKYGIGGRRERGLLTPNQNKDWKGIFMSTFKRLVAHGVPIPQAKAKAARTAWAILKARGAKTKLAVLGNRKLPIGINTSRLYNSLAPGGCSGGKYSKANSDQIAEIDNKSGEMVLGTKVPYASHFHAKRKLWPGKARMKPWLKDSLARATEAVQEQVAKQAER